MNANSRVAGLMAGAVFSFVLITPIAGQAGSPAQTCRFKQITAVGKAVSLIFKKCYAAGAKRGTAYDRICMSDTKVALGAGLDAAENVLTCDQEAIDLAVWTRLESLADDVAAGEIAYQTGGSCAASKLKATAKKCQSYAKCYAAAAKTGSDVDRQCLIDASSKFAATFLKLDATGDCSPTGNASEVELLVDAAMNDLNNLYTVGTTTTTTEEVPTP